MKHTHLCLGAAAILLAVFSSFTIMPVDRTDTQTSVTENDLLEITPLITSTIMLYDTTKFNNVKQANSSQDYIPGYGTKLLTYAAFNSLKKQLKETFNDPKALIYSDPEINVPLNLNERVNLVAMCDSLTSTTIDASRKENVKKMFKRDPGSLLKKISVLTFFESWYYNKHTGEIVKKQLGYSVGQWDQEKEAVREWYLYFTSQEARVKYIKNW